MSEYYIKIKQKDSEVEFSTSDKTEFNSRLAELMQLSGALDSINNTNDNLQKLSNLPVNDKIDIISSEDVAKTMRDVTEKLPKKLPLNVVKPAKAHPIFEEAYELEVAEISELFDETEETVSIESVEEDIEAVVSEDVVIEEEQEQEQEHQEESVEVLNSDFDKILEKSLQNPVKQVSPNFTKDDNLAELLSNKKIKTPEDALIVIAGFISDYENAERFTLKSINKKYFPIKGAPIGHDEIHELICMKLIKIVPNLTDTKTLTEYTLTAEGEEYYYELTR